MSQQAAASAGVATNKKRRKLTPATIAEYRRGWLYSLPDWAMILLLFVVPIVLLVYMSFSRWSLMGGNRGLNFPTTSSRSSPISCSDSPSCSPSSTP